jgi:hypothetical protein
MAREEEKRRRGRGLVALSSPFLPLILLVACKGPGDIPKSTTTLRLSGAPPTAEVYVDDQPIGELSFVQAHGVALPPGLHRITVQAPGYFPHDVAVQAKEPERVGDEQPPIRLDVRLVPVPD